MAKRGYYFGCAELWNSRSSNSDRQATATVCATSAGASMTNTGAGA
jgi:hypothetical protein